MPNAIVFLGPTGSGKTTVASGVSRQLDLPLVSSGAIARSIAQQDAATRANLAAGGYAPELAIRAEVTAQVESCLISHGAFIIEGFPRKLEQLVLLEKTPAFDPLYVRLEVPIIECIRRLISRGRDDDDHPDAVAERLRHYNEHTMPVIRALGDEVWTLYGDRPSERLIEKVVDLYKGHETP